MSKNGRYIEYTEPELRLIAELGNKELLKQAMSQKVDGNLTSLITKATKAIEKVQERKGEG